jgi:hypothetical protein
MDGRLRHMRPGQHNNKRGRNRNNRHRSGGGGGGGGGGNGSSKVFDSNGPDVKLRGTAQTVAEKYLQLARDAQSSGDPVMAESYFQFADHYYRVWLAVQPVGQPLQFSRRQSEEDAEDEDNENQTEGEYEGQAGGQGEGSSPQGVQDAQGVQGVQGDMAEGERRVEGQGEEGQGQQGYQNRPRRDFQPRDQNREGGNRFRNRWGKRHDRQGSEGGYSADTEGGERQERPDRPERGPRSDSSNGHDAPADSGNWEAPSFLKRPVPAVAGEGEAQDALPERAPRGRRPRGESSTGDVPQGD